MSIDENGKDGKLQYNINRETVKISALSTDKINRNKFLQATKYYLPIKVELQNKVSSSSYSSLGKASKKKKKKKKRKTIEDRVKN